MLNLGEGVNKGNSIGGIDLIKLAENFLLNGTPESCSILHGRAIGEGSGEEDEILEASELINLSKIVLFDILEEEGGVQTVISRDLDDGADGMDEVIFVGFASEYLEAVVFFSLDEPDDIAEDILPGIFISYTIFLIEGGDNS